MKFVLFFCLFALLSAGMADVVVGGTMGYSFHSISSTEIDAVTGATSSESKSYSLEHGGVLGVFTELPLFFLSHGNIALKPSFSVTVPGTFLHGGGAIIYRNTSGESAFRGGLGLQWVSDQREDEELQCLTGIITAGFDFGELFGMRLGAEMDAAVACPGANEVEIEDQVFEKRMNFVQLKLVISEVL